MVMKHYTMLNCEIEVDEEKTKQWYANADEWGCECGHCINFLEVAKQRKLPGKILNYLSAFGIPPEKATYVCCLNGDTEKPLYQFSYRIAGSILKDTSSTIIEDTHFCHETYPYGAPEFPEPHFDLEFYFELPWLLDKAAQHSVFSGTDGVNAKARRRTPRFLLSVSGDRRTPLPFGIGVWGCDYVVAKFPVCG